MNRKILYLLLISAVFVYTGCLEQLEDLPDEVIGLAPLYAVDDWETISVTEPQDIQQLGKIYYKAPYIYATDRARGIHVIDNFDPEVPVKVAFLQIAGNSDLAIKGNTLFANNVRDLVALDISSLDSVRVVSRQKDAFQIVGTTFPENYSGYFECVDPEMGEVVGWYETTLNQPECWR
ncbi:MAG: hypothetical protein AAGJ82_11545 [Bacteroidota bacterium]